MNEQIAARSLASIVLVAVVALGAAAPACKQPARPKADVWTRQWHDLQSALPTRDAILAAEDPRPLCSAALARARDAEQDLFPAPDEVIGATARAWFRAMLGVYMRCETDGAHDELDEGYERAARIEQELEAALRTKER